MGKIKVVRYGGSRRHAWDEFVAAAKNGVFLFQRDYMDYHADRFPDASIMFYDEAGHLVGLLPATEREGRVLASHAGLTFGGIVAADSMKAGLMLELFDAMLDHLRRAGYARFVYKVIPHIYHRLPAEEDLYALFRLGARLFRRDLSSTIDMRTRLPYSKGRKYSIKLATRHGVEFSRSDDYQTFLAIEECVLTERHGVRPVHTAAELAMLATRFPENIKLFAARRSGRMVAGVVIYESEQVAHAQYIGATEEGREVGASDLIIGLLINGHYAGKRYFDFGISTERDGLFLNEGLVEYKQGFGARAVVYDSYELAL